MFFNEPTVTIPMSEYKELIRRSTVFAYLRRQVIADKYRTKDDVALFNIDPMELEDEENATE